MSVGTWLCLCLGHVDPDFLLLVICLKLLLQSLLSTAQSTVYILWLPYDKPVVREDTQDAATRIEFRVICSFMSLIRHNETISKMSKKNYFTDFLERMIALLYGAKQPSKVKFLSAILFQSRKSQ